MLLADGQLVGPRASSGTTCHPALPATRPSSSCCTHTRRTPRRAPRRRRWRWWAALSPNPDSPAPHRCMSITSSAVPTPAVCRSARAVCRSDRRTGTCRPQAGGVLTDTGRAMPLCLSGLRRGSPSALSAAGLDCSLGLIVVNRATSAHGKACSQDIRRCHRPPWGVCRTSRRPRAARRGGRRSPARFVPPP